MNNDLDSNFCRRDFLKTSPRTVAGLSVLSGISLPHVHAAGSDENADRFGSQVWHSTGTPQQISNSLRGETGGAGRLGRAGIPANGM